MHPNVTEIHDIQALRLENAKLKRAAERDADVLESLNLSLEESQAENAKLREQIHWLKKSDVLHVLTDQELADQQRHEREMQASIEALNADKNMLREMLSESRQANEHIFTELKRYKDVMRTRPIAMNALFDEYTKLRKVARGMYGMLAMFDAILGNHDACETPRPLIFGEDKSFKDVMHELGFEVPHD